MISLTAGTECRLLPDSWEEAGPLAWDLLRDLVSLPPGAGKLRALRRLTGLTAAQFQLLNVEEVQALDAGTPWLGMTPVTAPLREHMRYRLRSYFWPGEAFLDGQMLAFVLADEYYLEAMNGTGAEAIDAQRHLVATLARPRRSFRRAPLEDREEVEHRARRFTDLPPAWTAQALMYWTGVKQTMHELYGEFLFQQEEDAAPGGFTSTAPNYNWTSILQDVAEGGAFGDLRAVHRANAHEVYQYLARRQGQLRDERRYHESLKK